MNNLIDICVVAMVVFAVLTVISGVRILCAKGFGWSRCSLVYVGFFTVVSVLSVVFILYFYCPVYLNISIPAIGLWLMVKLFRLFSKIPLK